MFSDLHIMFVQKIYWQLIFNGFVDMIKLLIALTFMKIKSNSNRKTCSVK